MTAVPLGDYAKLVRGITFKPDDKCDPDEPHAVVCMRTKNVQTELDDSDLIAVPSSLVKNPEKLLSPGDVLVSSANSWNLVGKCCRVKSLKYPSTAGGFISILRPTSDRIDPAYLYHWFASVPIQRRVRSFANQTTNISNLDHKRTMRLKIPLPPLTEQKRIVGILDAADALRAKRRESLAQLDTLLQSSFFELFGDTATNPRGWEQMPLGSVCGVGSSKRVFVEELVDEGVPFYRGTEIGQLGEDLPAKPTLFITAEHYEQLKAHSGVPTEDDLLLPSICPDGRIYRVQDDSPFYFKDGRVLWIKVDGARVDSRFLRYHLQAVFRANYDKIASGTTFAELKIFALKKLLIHVPPLKEQRRFNEIAGCIGHYRRQQAAHLEELDALFEACQSQAFAGEL